jgi:hypothetical protein
MRIRPRILRILKPVVNCWSPERGGECSLPIDGRTPSCSQRFPKATDMYWRRGERARVSSIAEFGGTSRRPKRSGSAPTPIMNDERAKKVGRRVVSSKPIPGTSERPKAPLRVAGQRAQRRVASARSAPSPCRGRPRGLRPRAGSRAADEVVRNALRAARAVTLKGRGRSPTLAAR